MTQASTILAPQDLGPPPRTVRRTGRPGYELIFRVIVGGVIFVGGSLLIALGELLLTHARGQLVDASVTSVQKRGRRAPERYAVTYTFTLDGQHVETVGDVNGARGPSLHVGQTIPIKTLVVLGERHNEISFSTWESTPVGMIAGCLALSLFGSFMFYLAWFRPMRYANLIRNGEIVTGHVVEVEDDTRNNDRTVTYTYHPPMADPQRGKTTGPEKSRPVPGDAVTVFYDPAKPWRSVAYEASGFEIDRAV